MLLVVVVPTPARGVLGSRKARTWP